MFIALTVFIVSVACVLVGIVAKIADKYKWLD